MLKKTAEISGVFRNIKREESFKNKHKIGQNSFTRDRKLGFDKMMTMMIKKSNKSLQNNINDTQLALEEDITISNSAYTQARAKLNYTAFEEFVQMARDIFYKDDEYEKYKEFSPMKVRCQIKEYAKDVSQARVSCLFDVLNNIAIDPSITNKNKSEDNNTEVYMKEL